MKKITIAFDIDGTLFSNTSKVACANEDIRTLLVILSKFKNVKILVWSGGGELYARQMVNRMGLVKYVDKYAMKDKSLNVDIAIDDQQAFELATFNLIVKEK